MFVIYIEKIKELRTERLLLSLDTRSLSLYQKLWYENTESYRNLLVQHQIETGNTRNNPIENAP